MNSENGCSIAIDPILQELGIFETSHGALSFLDINAVTHNYIHHSRQPIAVAAYTAINPTFAAGRFPSYKLTDLVDKIPHLDGAEHAALAKICDAGLPVYPSAAERGIIFGVIAWEIVKLYGLEGCFIAVRPYGYQGSHETMRPRGYDYDNGEPLPEELKAMRKSYRELEPLGQIMVLTLMHLYNPNTDRDFLVGNCPTKILAVDALRILRDDGAALQKWAKLVTHYAGW
jgi:hypothetical protein